MKIQQLMKRIKKSSLRSKITIATTQEQLTLQDGTYHNVPFLVAFFLILKHDTLLQCVPDNRIRVHGIKQYRWIRYVECGRGKRLLNLLSLVH